MNKIKERGMKIVFMVAACASVLAVFLICLFLFASGIPAIGKIGPLEFLFGTEWRPSNDLYGIFPMIVASIYVTGGAILVGVPVALLTSVFSSPVATQSLDITTFLNCSTQKTHNFRFFFYKKNNLFFYVFISFLKQFQKYSLRSYFQDFGFAFLPCCFRSSSSLFVAFIPRCT